VRNFWAEVAQFFLCRWPSSPAPWPYQYDMPSVRRPIFIFFLPRVKCVIMGSFLLFMKQLLWFSLKVAHFTIFPYIILFFIVFFLTRDFTSPSLISFISESHITVQETFLQNNLNIVMKIYFEMLTIHNVPEILMLISFWYIILHRKKVKNNLLSTYGF
jgi:hypothetical protein